MSSARDCLGPLSCFFPHTTFTRVQETVIPTLLQSDANVVVAAPTGSGKTALLEAAMLRLFKDRLLTSDAANMASQRRAGGAERKAVYICPIKALANEKYEIWRQRFPSLSVTLETGDQEVLRGSNEGLLEVPNADIIITTPERWDSITRRWKEGVVWSLVASVALLLLDEIHTVSEERGAALEAVVCRMKAIKATTSAASGNSTRLLNDGTPSTSFTRFVAISGTLPNIEDFAEWLQVSPSGVFSFTSADRPVPLTLRVVSYPSSSSNSFAFDRFLSFKLFGLIRQYSEGRPVIVFCASRREAINAAQRIIQDLREAASRDGSEERLQASEEVRRLAMTSNDKQLRALLLLGIAFHHAALSYNDRQLVERMFKDQYLSVICTTTTLALGVNLPAHLVIIKGTTFFKNGRREELPLSEVAQMSGRAGRPGLDTHGVALVLTTDDRASMYETLRHGDACTIVESRLHQNMIEHVNAEVALRTIHSFALGVEWIKTTFLWIRLRRCPRQYGILFSTKEEEISFNPEQFAAQLMSRILTELHNQGCIVIRRTKFEGKEEILHEDLNPLMMNCVVESNRTGRAMARRYILFKTVELLNTETAEVEATHRERTEAVTKTKEEEQKLSETVPNVSSTTRECTRNFTNKHNRIPFTLPSLLGMLSRAAEFEDLRLRKGDRSHLNEINKVIRFPLKSGMKGGREVREDWHKVYVLIQAQLEHVLINDFSLRNDCVRLWASAPRLARFLVDFACTRNIFSFMKESQYLLRCMEQRLCFGGMVLRQLEGVGESIAKALFQGGVKNFQDVIRTNPRKLESLCGKAPPFGTELRNKCCALVYCELSLRRCESDGSVEAIITEKENPQDLPQEELQQCNKSKYRHMALLVGDAESDTVLLFRQFTSIDLRHGPLLFTFKVPSSSGERIMGHVFTEHFLGNDVDVTLVLHECDDTTQDKSSFKIQTPRGSAAHSTTMNSKPAPASSAAKVEATATNQTTGNVHLESRSGAFEALTRDLEWVEGSRSSPLRDAKRRSSGMNHFSESVLPLEQSVDELQSVNNTTPNAVTNDTYPDLDVSSHDNESNNYDDSDNHSANDVEKGVEVSERSMESLENAAHRDFHVRFSPAAAFSSFKFCGKRCKSQKRIDYEDDAGTVGCPAGYSQEPYAAHKRQREESNIDIDTHIRTPLSICSEDTQPGSVKTIRNTVVLPRVYSPDPVGVTSWGTHSQQIQPSTTTTTTAGAGAGAGAEAHPTMRFRFGFHGSYPSQRMEMFPQWHSNSAATAVGRGEPFIATGWRAPNHRYNPISMTQQQQPVSSPRPYARSHQFFEPSEMFEWTNGVDLQPPLPHQQLPHFQSQPPGHWIHTNMGNMHQNWPYGAWMNSSAPPFHVQPNQLTNTLPMNSYCWNPQPPSPPSPQMNPYHQNFHNRYAATSFVDEPPSHPLVARQREESVARMPFLTARGHAVVRSTQKSTPTLPPPPPATSVQKGWW